MSILGRRLGLTCRRLWIRKISSVQLIYKEHGDPEKVVAMEDVDLQANKPEEGAVLIRFLATPVNPADLNQIQGIYPIRPALPAVGGNEGVAVVEEVADGVDDLRPGDWVLPHQAGSGTWQSRKFCRRLDLCPIPNSLPLPSAATLMVNPPTAYRMLKDFQDLQPGDWVIQNGANSAVGRAVISIAKKLSLKTLNVIRHREDIEDFQNLEMELMSLGADLVISDQKLMGKKGKVLLEQKIHSPLKLALNCVGGKSAMYLANALGNGGKMVTYGGMSKLPLQVPTGSLIFMDLELRGFWMSRWYQNHKEDEMERERMMDFLCGMIEDGSLPPPNPELVPFKEYKEALKVAGTGSGKKQILVYD